MLEVRERVAASGHGCGSDLVAADSSLISPLSAFQINTFLKETEHAKQRLLLSVV